MLRCTHPASTAALAPLTGTLAAAFAVTNATTAHVSSALPATLSTTFATTPATAAHTAAALLPTSESGGLPLKSTAPTTHGLRVAAAPRRGRPPLL